MKRLIKMIIALGYKIRYLGKAKIHATNTIILRGCTFEGKNSIGVKTYMSNTSMGYGSILSFSSEVSNTTIGRYCSVGSHVRVIAATHPTNMVSTYPAFYSDTYSVSYVDESKFTEHLVTDNGYECEIGNDVWICDNVLIKGGVKIGDGAIVGMGSVVLKDIEPYSIVAGVPAKEIRKRFDDETIEALMKLKWWDKPVDWVKEHASEFESPEKLIKNM